MASEWPTTRVGDVADSFSETHHFGKEQLIFLNTSDVLLGKILHHCYSPVKDWPGQAKKSIRKDDVLFSEIRPANGRYAYVDIDADDYVVSTKLMVIRARKDRIVPKFLYHFLTDKRITGWLQHLAESRSGTFPQITFDQIAELELALPPMTDQERISAFIDEIDNKLELVRRMNETLEAMAHALFKSWFVDFDPVRAKAEGRQPFGMDAATAALFPDSFQDSPLGKIPKRWHIGKMKEFVRLNRNSINPSEHPDEVFDHYSIPAFDEGRLPKAEKGEQVKSNKFFVPGCAVLLSKLNPRFPRVWLPAQSGVRRSICSTEFLVTTPYAFATSDYLYGIFRSDAFHAEFATLVTGTSSSHQRVKAEFLLEMDSVIPEERLVAQFSEQCTPLLSMVAANLEESQTLAATRDALLPKLISGEIRVKDAEQSTKVPT
jgi:type I restriction enzyme S subunit